ncbi:MAG: hypothetical protein N2691_00360 [Patescibacteria group bacterium]|nr:hypothetical protein [Patescibacteria group bacterium]
MSMNRIITVIVACGLFLSLISSFPPSVSAATISLFDVRANTTDLRRGLVFEVQVKASEISENLTANLVFDGKEYFAPGGGGACRSDSGLFLGWIEGEGEPIARIACTVPLSVPKDTKTVELIAYQFRGCDNGADRCSQLKSSQTFTLRDEDFDKVATEESDKIRDRIKKEVPKLTDIIAILWPRSGGSSGNDNNAGDGGSEETGDDSSSTGGSGSESSQEAGPPVSAETCKQYADGWFRYVCQVWTEIQANCNGQVLPENRMQCINSLPSLRNKPNTKQYMMDNASMEYCARGICSRGLQCMGWAQGMYSALRNDLPKTQNPFWGVGWPQDAIGKSAINAVFTTRTWDQCRQQVKPGQIMWVIYSLHIGIAQFEDANRSYYTLIDANTGSKSSSGWFKGEVDRRSLSASSSWRPTHCLVPTTR